MSGATEWLSTGQQGVIPPSVHPDGTAYEWEGKEIIEMSPERLQGIVQSWTGLPWNIDDAEDDWIGVEPISVDVLEMILMEVPSYYADNYESWLSVGIACYNSVVPDDRKAALALWDSWSKQSEKYSEGVCSRKWRTFRIRDGRQFTYRSLQKWTADALMLRQHAETAANDEDGRVSSARLKTKIKQTLHALNPEFSEGGLAQLFAACHHNLLAYNGGFGWLFWNGKKWEITDEPIKSRYVFLFYSALQRILYEELSAAEKELGQLQIAMTSLAMSTVQEKQMAQKERRLQAKIDKTAARLKALKRLSSNSGMSAVLEIAKDHPALLVPVNKFNARYDCLNLQNGIYLLDTHEMVPHSPDFYFTRLTNLSFDKEADATEFYDFENDLFIVEDDDEATTELRQFIRRAIGFTFRGKPVRESEHALFFCHGFGANGKSTLLGLLQYALGDFAVLLRPEALLSQYYGGKQAEDIAHLAGAKMAVTQEMPNGKRLNESIVKSLTGSAQSRAEFKYHTSFEFENTAKLWVEGNADLDIKGKDEGIWRRIKKIPFNARFDAANPETDENIGKTLRSNMGGFFKYVLDCIQRYDADGLLETAIITEATAELADDLNELADFYDIGLEFGKGNFVPANEIYKAYTTYAAANDQQRMTRRLLYNEIMSYAYAEKRLQLTRRKTHEGRLLVGVKLTATGEQWASNTFDI